MLDNDVPNITVTVCGLFSECKFNPIDISSFIIFFGDEFMKFCQWYLCIDIFGTSIRHINIIFWKMIQFINLINPWLWRFIKLLKDRGSARKVKRAWLTIRLTSKPNELFFKNFGISWLIIFIFSTKECLQFEAERGLSKMFVWK